MFDFFGLGAYAYSTSGQNGNKVAPVSSSIEKQTQSKPSSRKWCMSWSCMTAPQKKQSRPAPKTSIKKRSVPTPNLPTSGSVDDPVWKNLKFVASLESRGSGQTDNSHVESEWEKITKGTGRYSDWDYRDFDLGSPYPAQYPSDSSCHWYKDGTRTSGNTTGWCLGVTWV